MTLLSKSEYMLFLRHPAWLWLKKHDKTKLPPVDDNTQAIFAAGFRFESYAEQLFPGGVKIGWGDYASYLTLPNRTKAALEKGEKTLFQGRLEHDHITCIFDVITMVGKNTLDLYEVKSSTEAKPEHKLDLAFQLAVIEGAGYDVRKIYVVHVNNQYVRHGDIDVSEFTKVADVTEDVKELREPTAENIKKALAVANVNTCPDISPSNLGIGSLKDYLEIYKNLITLEPGNIYELIAPGTERLGNLESLGIKQLADIPADFPLTPAQQRQVQAVRENRVLIEAGNISEFLGTFEFPLYFLDYETMASVVPYFDGMRPYQQVPFQYSLHILDRPGAKLRHQEYLHRENSNPVRPLSEALQKDIGTAGTVLAWNAGFEKSCNATMGILEPKFKDFYEQVNNRVLDLMVPFSSGWYVHKDFGGSASIKKVLPVLAPHLSYAALGIHEGGAAQRLWMEAVLDGSRPKEKERILRDLDEYCKLDTLAMVEVYHTLAARKIGNQAEPLLRGSW